MPQGEEIRKNTIEKYLTKAFRKIRPQDTAKKKEYDELCKWLKEVYEWKKNEAEDERTARKEGKAFPSISSKGGNMRFRRMES